MTTARFDVGENGTDSSLTGFFAAALVVATVGVGFEPGAAAAGRRSIPCRSPRWAAPSVGWRAGRVRCRN